MSNTINEQNWTDTIPLKQVQRWYRQNISPELSHNVASL